MKELTNYIVESQKECKDIPDYTFSWIKTKDRWVNKHDCPIRYHLMCTPKDKTKDIVVFRNFAWYRIGYDQGHASNMQYYLQTIIAGGRGNGHGESSECEPYWSDVEKSDMDAVKYYLDGTPDKYFSDTKMKALTDAAMTYPYKTKISEIKQDLNQ